MSATSDDDLVLYRCTVCGKLSVSLGWIHGHIEAHRGYTRFNLQLPFGKTAPANVSELMKRTEVLQVVEYDVVDLEDVEVTS